MLEPLGYTPFSLDVLRTYKLAAGRPLSLVNWVYFQTKQHPEMTTYLAEFGFQKLSDWALLNRVRIRQLEQLSAKHQALVRAFHSVYRRDRRLSAHMLGTHTKPSSGRCPTPTAAQLQEMNTLLSQQALQSEAALLQALKQVAVQLRQFDVWRSRQPLEHFDGTTGQYQPRSDLPTTILETEVSEESEMLAELHQQLAAALKTSLYEVLTARIVKLKKSKKYGPFATKFGVGLQHYYQEGLSLKEIAPLLGMSSWDQARRILNPGDFLNRVRSHTFQHFSTQVLNTIENKKIIPWPPTPAYLQALSEQLEAFADAEIFQAATAEMKAGSHRKLDSVYAQQLLLTLETFSSTLHPSTVQSSTAHSSGAL